MTFSILLQAAGTPGLGGSGGIFGMIIPFALIILVFYFLIIRPQNKKQKDSQAMIQALKKNDKVVTAGGIRGTVVAVKDDSIVLRVDDNVKLEFNKSAVSSVLEVQGDSSKSADEPKKNGKKNEGSDSKEK